MEMNTPQTSGQGDPDRATVSSPVDGTCSEKTVRGEPCRRLAVASGLCVYHLHHQRSVTVVDPLEVVDWASWVEVLRVVDVGFAADTPDEESDGGRRAAS